MAVFNLQKMKQAALNTKKISLSAKAVKQASAVSVIKVKKTGGCGCGK